MIALAIVSALVGLGTWQVQRLAWKTDLIATMEARMQASAINLKDALDLTVAEAEWRPVTTSGRLLDRHSVALYRISTEGDAGYQILTPMAVDGVGDILINRGFVAASSFQDALSGVAPPSYEAVTVTGILRPDEEQSAFTNDNDPRTGAWYWIDLDALGREAGVELLPVMIVADADPAGGELIGDQARFDPPNQHLQYAITWYSLAVAALVIYVLLLRRRRGAGL